MQVREIMTANPACVLPSDTLQTAGQRMIECNCGVLPVVDNMQGNRLIGVVTDRDIVCRVIAKGMDCRSASIQDAMTTGKLWTASPNDSVDALIDEMERAQVRRVPVVDEQNRVIGIVALADIANKVQQEEMVGEVVERISLPMNVPHA